MATGVRVNAAVASSARTAVQGGAGWVITEFIDAFHIYTMDPRQYGISVIVAGAVFAFLQNVAENKLGKAILKKLPTTKTVALLNSAPPE